MTSLLFAFFLLFSFTLVIHFYTQSYLTARYTLLNINCKLQLLSPGKGRQIIYLLICNYIRHRPLEIKTPFEAWH